MDVVLIGPIAAGKSTLGTLLSAALGLPQCSMDDVRFRYYGEIGYDESLASRLYQTEGFWGLCIRAPRSSVAFSLVPKPHPPAATQRCVRPSDARYGNCASRRRISGSASRHALRTYAA